MTQLLDWIVLIAWLCCLANTIVNFALLPRLTGGAPRSGPLVSIIIPARDEERSIGGTVRAMLAQTYAPLEVIVVNDRSTDATADILAAIHDPRLTVIDGLEPPDGWLGKPWALEQGSGVARGALLLFVDADIFYAPEAVAAAVAELRESGVSLLALLPDLRMKGFWENVMMPQLALAAFTFIPLWLSNRARSVRLAIGGGTGNLVVREDYMASGGHGALRDSVVDDVALARLVRRSGFRSSAARAERLVSVRMYHGLRGIIDGFTKNTFAVFGRSYALVIIVAVLGLLFHVVPYFEALAGNRRALATVLIITATRIILFGALQFSIAAALFAHPLMIVIWTWISLVSAWKTGIRRRLTWRGRTYDAASTRFGADR